MLRSPLRRSLITLSVAAATFAPATSPLTSPTVRIADTDSCGRYPRVAVRNDCWIVRNEEYAVRWRQKEVARCIRHWESGHDYEAVSPRGSFRGAYQFTQSTFDSLGPDRFDGLRANRAHKYLQDLKARALYRERGLQPWPTPRERCD